MNYLTTLTKLTNKAHPKGHVIDNDVPSKKNALRVHHKIYGNGLMLKLWKK